MGRLELKEVENVPGKFRGPHFWALQDAQDFGGNLIEGPAGAKSSQVEDDLLHGRSVICGECLFKGVHHAV